MGKKCVVPACKSNYDKSTAKNCSLKDINNEKNQARNNIPVFGFPSKEKFPEERNAWVRAIPLVTEDVVNNYKTPPVICIKHWPDGFVKVKGLRGRERPRDPPSIFTGVQPSLIPTPAPMPRPNKRSSYDARTLLNDEFPVFKDADKMSYDSLVKNIASHNFINTTIVSYKSGDDFWIQSVDFISGIPKFSVMFKEDLSYEAFFMGIRTNVPSLSTNRVTLLDSWSKLDEVVRFLRCKESTRHENVLQQHIECMKGNDIGAKIYSTDIMIRAFNYFASSRHLYNNLRADYKLPSIRTLQNMTSKVGNMSDQYYITNVFNKLEDRQKQCIILVDEIYVKRSLLYHGGQLFGKAENNKDELANAALGIMIKCQFGGPSFLFKMVPVRGMTADFLYDQVDATLKIIENANGRPISIIADGNRTNQKFFKMFETIPLKPWLTTGGLFLLFDFVHLLKNIRNNWLTESTGELNFEHEDHQFTAKWSHLLQLYNLELQETEKDKGIRGLSSLTEVAVRPKPVERQSVSTCLRIFSDATLHALKAHPGLDTQEVEGTITFVQKINKMWKILNVRSRNKDVRKNDPDSAEVKSTDDPSLRYLLDIAKMFEDMGKASKGKRQKTLTTDTAKGLVHTLNGLVDLCEFQLSNSHDFVLIGDYTTDPLEKEFGKLRQGSGGTYFLSLQQITEKLDISKTKHLLKLSEDVRNINADAGHQCCKCKFSFNGFYFETFDNLPALEQIIPTGTKMALVHVAGYVTRKDELTEEQLFEVQSQYYQEYGSFTQSLDRGGLKVPSDTACQWTFFSFIMFNAVKENVCRTSLAKCFMSISDSYDFKMETSHANILSNIFFKNYCTQSTPRSSKEPRQKILKLSES